MATGVHEHQAHHRPRAPATSTEEIWYDPRAGLERAVLRVDGRVRADVAGPTCFVIGGGGAGAHNGCGPPPPFDLVKSGFRKPTPFLAQPTRTLGRGTYRGHDVVWLEPLVGFRGHWRPTNERVALDAHTHRPIGDRVFARGRLWREIAITWLKDVPGKGFSFIVPRGASVDASGGLTLKFPPIPADATIDRPSSLDVARKALGRVPVWLGRSFRGHRLGPVTVGDEVARTTTERRLLPARFVRFFYGDFELWEFGSARPFFWLQGPRPGHVVRQGRSEAVLSRDGLLVRIVAPNTNLTGAEALAIARALRPLPASQR